MLTPAHAPALVAKTDLQHVEQFLLLTAAGQPLWTHDPAAATAFPSLREATGAALRLPAGQRAFGLPRPGALAA
jgi:hypothetical protein